MKQLDLRKGCGGRGRKEAVLGNNCPLCTLLVSFMLFLEGQYFQILARKSCPFMLEDADTSALDQW